MIKPQARSMPIPERSDKGTPEDQQMANIGAEQASEEEVTQAKGIVENIAVYIYSDGAEDIIEKSGGSAKEVGLIAGNLVTNEIALEEEEGQDISRDIEIEIMAEIVHEITDLLLAKGVINLPDENSEQAFMGEALTFAISAAMDSDDPQITNESMMNLVTNMLNSSEQSGQPVDGVPLPQEMMNGQS